MVVRSPARRLPRARRASAVMPTSFGAVLISRPPLRSAPRRVAPSTARSTAGRRDWCASPAAQEVETIARARDARNIRGFVAAWQGVSARLRFIFRWLQAGRQGLGRPLAKLLTGEAPETRMTPAIAFPWRGRLWCFSLLGPRFAGVVVGGGTMGWASRCQMVVSPLPSVRALTWSERPDPHPCSTDGLDRVAVTRGSRSLTIPDGRGQAHVTPSPAGFQLVPIRPCWPLGHGHISVQQARQSLPAMDVIDPGPPGFTGIAVGDVSSAMGTTRAVGKRRTERTGAVNLLSERAIAHDPVRYWAGHVPPLLLRFQPVVNP